MNATKTKAGYTLKVTEQEAYELLGISGAGAGQFYDDLADAVEPATGQLASRIIEIAEVKATTERFFATAAGLAVQS